MFNKSQLGAISHHLGPAIILAGPGSGKTTVITHRAKKLIEEYGVPPEKIMVVTFTKAAAINMRHRFLNLMNNTKAHSKTYPVTFGTFHSAFYRILRLTYNYKEDNILGENQKLDIIKEIAIRLNISVPSMIDFVQNAVSEISKIKGSMLELKTYVAISCTTEDFKRVFEAYEKELEVLGKMDFDDILIRCHNLLKENPAILKQWQDTYSHILIDEFQDINRVQYEIIKLLAMPENNIFIVGDDDQSIYGFRGASPGIMRQFKEDFPNAREILLNINYRCAKLVAWWADRLISHNKDRFDKSILAVRKTKEKCEIKQFRNQQHELSYVTNKIKEYIKNGVKPEDIAILVRNNSSIKIMTEILENEKIKSKARRKKTLIFDSYVGQDVLAYIRAAINYDKHYVKDNEDLIRIINKPARYISRQVLATDGMTIDGLKKEYKNGMIRNNIDKLLFDFNIIRNATPFGAVNYIRKGAGYEEYLRQYAKEKGKKLKDLIYMLDEIQHQAEQYRTLEEWIESATEQDVSGEPGGVHIMTMHSSKGLEFKVVFIVDANQGIIPSTKAVREEDFEEERRVFYVAMTRAIDVLNIYGIKEYAGGEMQMSMFVSEILDIDEN